MNLKTELTKLRKELDKLCLSRTFPVFFAENLAAAAKIKTNDPGRTIIFIGENELKD